MYFLRRFEHGDWTVAVEDDDRVVYAYLLRHNQIVGDVWLYNRPRSTAVDEFTLMPPVVLAGTPTPHHCASNLACLPTGSRRSRGASEDSCQRRDLALRRPSRGRAEASVTHRDRG